MDDSTPILSHRRRPFHVHSCTAYAHDWDHRHIQLVWHFSGMCHSTISDSETTKVCVSTAHKFFFSNTTKGNTTSLTYQWVTLRQFCNTGGVLSTCSVALPHDWDRRHIRRAWHFVDTSHCECWTSESVVRCWRCHDTRHLYEKTTKNIRYSWMKERRKFSKCHWFISRHGHVYK